jgi:hypothetical protein
MIVGQYLAPNESIRIVPDDSTTRDYVVRLHGHPRTKTVTWVALGIIGFGRRAMRPHGGRISLSILGLGSLGCDQGRERRRGRSDERLGGGHPDVTSHDSNPK